MTLKNARTIPKYQFHRTQLYFYLFICFDFFFYLILFFREREPAVSLFRDDGILMANFDTLFGEKLNV